jgi:hypothetical protein
MENKRGERRSEIIANLREKYPLPADISVWSDETDYTIKAKINNGVVFVAEKTPVEHWVK